MAPDISIASLRTRVTELVEQEGALLTEAFELSRAGGDRRGVDALFARVQAIQVERNQLKKQIGDLLGTHRLHVAAEVWRPGIYEYRHEVGGHSLRVRVVSGTLGLQVFMPGKSEAVRIETLKGSFDGPLAADESAGQESRGLRTRSAEAPVAAAEEAGEAPAPGGRRRPTRRSRG